MPAPGSKPCNLGPGQLLPGKQRQEKRTSFTPWV